MTIAEEFKIGNTQIRICTDFCVSPEETERIVERICRNALPELRKVFAENATVNGGSINVPNCDKDKKNNSNRNCQFEQCH